MLNQTKEDMQLLVLTFVISFQIASLITLISLLLIAYIIKNYRSTLNSKYLLAKYYEKERVELNKVV